MELPRVSAQSLQIREVLKSGPASQLSPQVAHLGLTLQYTSLCGINQAREKTGGQPEHEIDK